MVIVIPSITRPVITFTKLRTRRSFRYLKLSLLAMNATVLIFVIRTIYSSHMDNDKYITGYDLSANVFRPMDAGDLVVLNTPTPKHCHSSDIGLLEQELREILSEAEKESQEGVVPKPNTAMTCSMFNIADAFPECLENNGMERRCAIESLPEDPADRLKSLLHNEKLCITPEYRAVLKEMGEELQGQYDVIIISAVSSADYLESQTMLKNLHEDIFPVLSNFTLVVYDVGLSDDEHLEYKKYCLCRLIKFPFHRFPPELRSSKCVWWKPLLIRAHYDRANFVIWMDASIRYFKPFGLTKALQLAETYGVQQRRASSVVSNSFRALPSVFHHFGDTPCAHFAFTQSGFDWGIYHRSPLVREAILDSWVSCGLNVSCACPRSKNSMQECPPNGDKRERKLGVCMQEQSVMGIILAKVYLDQYNVVLITGESFLKSERRAGSKYFKKLSIVYPA